MQTILLVWQVRSFALTRVIQSALYGVTATDPATYAGISTLLLVAVIACLIPTQCAVAGHPTIAFAIPMKGVLSPAQTAPSASGSDIAQGGQR